MKNSQKESILEIDDNILFAPVWFRFLEWVLIIGIFSYLADLTKHWSVVFISCMNYSVFILYVQSVLFSVDWQFPFFNNKKRKRLFAILFASILAALFYLFVNIVIIQIKEYL